MPLWKTFSGTDKQVIPPRQWTFVYFGEKQRSEFIHKRKGTWLVNVILRVEYPDTGCPTTLRGRLIRYPNTPQEDRTGHKDVDPIPGLTRHHHWDHFLKLNRELPIAFKIWHNGRNPIVLDGRQFKTTILNRH